MDSLLCVILAAGFGKRMGGELPKVLSPTSETTLIQHVLATSAHLKPKRTAIVVGYKRELVEKVVSECVEGKEHTLSYAVQESQLGTGDAVKSALPALSGFSGAVLIICGDVPLTKPETLKQLVELHEQQKATLTLVSFRSLKNHPYGRIIRKVTDKSILKIVEARDCSAEELQVDEYNAGIYVVDSAFLKPAVEQLTDDNVQKEFYLTDIIQRAVKEGQKVAALCLPTEEEVLGVNTKVDLALVNQILNRRRVEKFISQGVAFVSPENVWIDSEVIIESGAAIGPNTQLQGKSTIGAHAHIEGTAIIRNSIIETRAHIKLGCHIEDSFVGEESSIGPFAHIRPGTKLGKNVRVGNFVELKKAELADDVKAPHLSYLGDCSIGKQSNIGAGTITCNYDGYSKNHTSIGEHVFVGSNSTLIAPLTIENDAFIAAGSVITKDVEESALGIARAQQTVKSGWAARWHKVNGDRK